MYKFERGILTEDKGFYEKYNPGYTVTGETLSETFIDKFGLETGCVYVVMKGPFTRYCMCRDCGDHYIIARWCRYDRIDKNTLEITYDVEDI